MQFLWNHSWVFRGLRQADSEVYVEEQRIQSNQDNPEEELSGDTSPAKYQDLF